MRLSAGAQAWLAAFVQNYPLPPQAASQWQRVREKRPFETQTLSFRCSHCATHFLDICEALGPGRPGGPSSAKKRGSCPEAMPPQTKSREDYAVPLHALRWDAPKGPWRLFHAGTSPPFCQVWWCQASGTRLQHSRGVGAASMFDTSWPPVPLPKA